MIVIIDTPLHLACKLKVDLSLIFELIKNGADVNIKNEVKEQAPFNHIYYKLRLTLLILIYIFNFRQE
jgi:hypothetical protein